VGEREDVAQIAAGLSPLEAELLTCKSAGWGSWMFSVGGDLAAKGLMCRLDGSYYITELGTFVAAHLNSQEPSA